MMNMNIYRLIHEKTKETAKPTLLILKMPKNDLDMKCSLCSDLFFMFA